jgi:ABC-type nitrate/sulfonate/bicarbonate transport system substrate-binding protein
MRRRDFLKGAGYAAAGLTLAGSPLRAESLGKMAYLCSWVKNFQFAGEYIADYKKYFAEEGLQVDILAGGPNVVAEPMIISGKALVGQSGSDTTANAVNQGGPFKIIGTNYQKSPFSIISMSAKPIHEPKDLIGKTIGIQSNNRWSGPPFCA